MASSFLGQAQPFFFKGVQSGITAAVLRAVPAGFAGFLLFLSLIRSPAAQDFSGVGNSRNPVELSAEQLYYDEPSQTIVAKGDVEMVQNKRILRARRVQYHMPTDTARATGEVKLLEPDGNVLFAETLELSRNLTEGFVENFQARLDDGSRFRAATGVREDADTIVLEDAFYSPCRLCEGKDGPPVWSLQADKITHDKKKSQISYNNARFNLMGVPVFYTPYLRHTDGTIDRRSGFLPPRFGVDEELGAHASIPYYYALSPDKDLTLAVQANSKRNPLISGEYRQRFARAELDARGSFTVADRLAPGGGGTVTEDSEPRGHIFAEAKWDISNHWRAGADLALTTDEQFLRRYGISGTDVLENDIFAEYFTVRNYATARLQAFQDLRIEDDADQPNILPVMEADFFGEPGGLLGGRWRAGGQFLNLLREGSGTDVLRAVGEAEWQRRDILPLGVSSALTASLRGDLFQIQDGVAPGPGQRDVREVRMVPRLHWVGKWPLISDHALPGQVVITPGVALNLAPDIDNDQFDFPNEDSLDVRLDTLNLYDPNRFPGLDRVEDNGSVSLGLDTAWYGRLGQRLEAEMGRVFRLDSESPFPQGSGLAPSDSDWVARIRGYWPEHLDAEYRLQLDEETGDPRRHEADVAFGLGLSGFDMRYLRLDPVQGTGLNETREEVFAGARLRLADHWRVRGSTLYDLTDDEQGLRRATAGLDFFSDCLAFSLIGERNVIDDVSGESDFSVILRIGLKNIGGFNPLRVIEGERYGRLGRDVRGAEGFDPTSCAGGPGALQR